MVVKIKKLVENAIIPSYSKPGDAGLDLTAISKSYDEFGNIVYGTGLAFEIPKGYVGLLFPRSSNCNKTVFLTNSVGVLDSGYRGEVMFKFKPTLKHPNSKIQYLDYEISNRIGQLIIIPYPNIEFQEVQELGVTERNTGGYGSTGN